MPYDESYTINVDVESDGNKPLILRSAPVSLAKKAGGSGNKFASDFIVAMLLRKASSLKVAPLKAKIDVPRETRTPFEGFKPGKIKFKDMKTNEFLEKQVGSLEDELLKSRQRNNNLGSRMRNIMDRNAKLTKQNKELTPKEGADLTTNILNTKYNKQPKNIISFPTETKIEKAAMLPKTIKPEEISPISNKETAGASAGASQSVSPLRLDSKIKYDTKATKEAGIFRNEERATPTMRDD